MRLVERELTERVALTDARGRLNPDAVGWTRQPLHDTSGIGRGFWPRNKRWEYWSFVGPRFIVGLTVSAVDYAGIEGVWVFDRETKREWKRWAMMATFLTICICVELFQNGRLSLHHGIHP